MTAFDNDRWEAERKARLERVGASLQIMQTSPLEKAARVIDRISKAMAREAFQRDIEWARFVSGEYWGRVTEDGFVVFPRPDKEPQQ